MRSTRKNEIWRKPTIKGGGEALSIADNIESSSDSYFILGTATLQQLLSHNQLQDPSLNTTAASLKEEHPMLGCCLTQKCGVLVPVEIHPLGDGFPLFLSFALRYSRNQL